MTFRARLLLAFAGLALVPTVLLAAFTLDRLGRALDLWNTRGVDAAFQSALDVSKTALTHMDGTATAQARDWALALPPDTLTLARRTAIRAGLHAAGLDFLQLYRREGNRWRLIEEVVPEGEPARAPVDLTAELTAALADHGPIHSARGALGAAAEIAPDAGASRNAARYALTAGMRVEPGFFAGVERVGEGVGFYRRLGVVRDVSRAYVLLLVAALVIVLAAAALWVSNSLAGGLTQPLLVLEQALERVAAGDLETRVTPAGAREVRTLGERFNAMTERLATARTALAEAERQAAWREVARRLAHEFKNILTPMSLSLRRLRRRADQVPADQRPAVVDSLAAMDQSISDLTRLAEQFSQYARLPEPRLERLDLASLVRDAAALHEPDAVHVRITTGDGALPVRADRLLLSRAVHNLVLNACEASSAGGEVEVLASRRGDQAEVEVLDRGSGLAAEVAGRLFEPYVSTKARGSGLGLSLVRDIAHQHDGTVTVENREGGGARARLTLPLFPEDGA